MAGNLEVDMALSLVSVRRDSGSSRRSKLGVELLGGHKVQNFNLK